MKLRIYNEKEIEHEVTLRLINSSGRVILTAVDSKGDSLPGGYIIEITISGRLKSYSQINKALGLPLDENGKIRPAI